MYFDLLAIPTALTREAAERLRTQGLALQLFLSVCVKKNIYRKKKKATEKKKK